MLAAVARRRRAGAPCGDAIDAGDQPQRLVGELERGVAILLQAQAEKRRGAGPLFGACGVEQVDGGAGQPRQPLGARQIVQRPHAGDHPLQRRVLPQPQQRLAAHLGQPPRRRAHGQHRRTQRVRTRLCGGEAGG